MRPTVLTAATWVARDELLGIDRVAARAQGIPVQRSPRKAEFHATATDERHGLRRRLRADQRRT
jgi:hypothetical protein